MYIKTFDDLILVLTAQKSNVVQYQGEVGATAQDITDINETLDNALAINAFFESVDVDKKTVTQSRDSFYRGVPNTAIGAIPMFQQFVWPSVTPPVAGQIPLANTRNTRFANVAQVSAQHAWAEAGPGSRSTERPSPAGVAGLGN